MGYYGSSFPVGYGLLAFLVFAAFWVGVGVLYVWVSKLPHLHERKLLLIGLGLALGSMLFCSLAFAIGSFSGWGYGGDVGPGGDGYGGMMGGWYGR